MLAGIALRRAAAGVYIYTARKLGRKEFVATYFKLVLADMTLANTKAGKPSPMEQIGYNALVSRLEHELSRVTRLIPKVFTTAVVVVTRFDSKPSVSEDDGLVLIEAMPELSHLSKETRRIAINAPQNVAGMTETGGSGAITAAVFLSRCNGNAENVASAVIHELAHAKSSHLAFGKMHSENPGGILATDGGSLGRAFLDSEARWLSKHLPTKVVFEMKHFGSAS